MAESLEESSEESLPELFQIHLKEFLKQKYVEIRQERKNILDRSAGIEPILLGSVPLLLGNTNRLATKFTTVSFLRITLVEICLPSLLDHMWYCGFRQRFLVTYLINALQFQCEIRPRLGLYETSLCVMSHPYPHPCWIIEDSVGKLQLRGPDAKGCK